MLYVGIDPGLDGAVAAIDHRADFIGVWDAPTIEVKRGKGKKRNYVEAEMAAILRRLYTHGGPAAVLLAVENVHAMPKQGVTSMFSMGFGLGLWLGAVAGLQLPYERVEPRTWKAGMGLATGSDKGASVMLASRLFPEAPLTRKKDHGRAEALLMAAWLRRKHECPIR